MKLKKWLKITAFASIASLLVIGCENTPSAMESVQPVTDSKTGQGPGRIFTLSVNPYSSVGTAHNDGLQYMLDNFDTNKLHRVYDVVPDTDFESEMARLSYNYQLSIGDTVTQGYIDTLITELAPTLYLFQTDDTYDAVAAMVDTVSNATDKKYLLKLMSIFERIKDEDWSFTKSMDSSVALEQEMLNDTAITVDNFKPLSAVAVLIASTDFWSTYTPPIPTPQLRHANRADAIEWIRSTLSIGDQERMRTHKIRTHSASAAFAAMSGALG